MFRQLKVMLGFFTPTFYVLLFVGFLWWCVFEFGFFITIMSLVTITTLIGLFMRSYEDK